VISVLKGLLELQARWAHRGLLEPQAGSVRRDLQGRKVLLALPDPLGRQERLDPKAPRVMLAPKDLPEPRVQLARRDLPDLWVRQDSQERREHLVLLAPKARRGLPVRKAIRDLRGRRELTGCRSRHCTGIRRTNQEQHSPSGHLRLVWRSMAPTFGLQTMAARVSQRCGPAMART
jgi:hypothetical protein